MPQCVLSTLVSVTLLETIQFHLGGALFLGRSAVSMILFNRFQWLYNTYVRVNFLYLYSNFIGVISITISKNNASLGMFAFFHCSSFEGKSITEGSVLPFDILVSLVNITILNNTNSITGVKISKAQQG